MRWGRKKVIMFHDPSGNQVILFPIKVLFPLTCDNLSPIFLFGKVTSPRHTTTFNAAFGTKEEIPFES